jgi:PAS domain S-box-containing protein
MLPRAHGKRLRKDACSEKVNIFPNLLIVDDSPENLELLDAIIQKKKIKANVIRALSGQMAIEKIREINLALAILDVEMPGMNGYELASRINEARTNDKVPIIFLTAKYLSGADISKGYDAGAVDYILKPFNDRILVSKINVFLDLFNYKQEILRDAALLKQSSLELAQSNQALTKSEEKYRTVADYTYDWEYWTGRDGRVIYMSPAAEKITGHSIEEFIEDPALIDNIVFGEDKELWESHKKEEHNCGPGETAPEVSFRVVTSGGNIRWIVHVCRRIYSDGKCLGTRASNRDITEKAAIEGELFNVTVEVEERERNRFAGELHDGLGPLLSTIKLYFQWLAETDDTVKKKLITEKGNNNIEKAIQTTREVSQGLSSVILSKYGYVDAVLSFIKSINDMQKLSIDLNFNTKARFNTLREAALYRITTELINNTLKYAKATHVNISYFYSQEKNRISFTYTDDGVGFDLALVEKSKDSLGLLNIQQRIMLIRGVITIKTAPGKGLEIYIQMPLC